MLEIVWSHDNDYSCQGCQDIPKEPSLIVQRFDLTLTPTIHNPTFDRTVVHSGTDMGIPPLELFVANQDFKLDIFGDEEIGLHFGISWSGTDCALHCGFGGPGRILSAASKIVHIYQSFFPHEVRYVAFDLFLGVVA